MAMMDIAELKSASVKDANAISHAVLAVNADLHATAAQDAEISTVTKQVTADAAADTTVVDTKAAIDSQGQLIDDIKGAVDKFIPLDDKAQEVKTATDSLLTTHTMTVESAVQLQARLRELNQTLVTGGSNSSENTTQLMLLVNKLIGGIADNRRQIQEAARRAEFLFSTR